MTTAHTKKALIDAHERLRGMFEKAGADTYKCEMKVLECGDVDRVREWARNYRPWPNYVWPTQKIRAAVQFLASAYERVGTVKVTKPIEYTEHGEYAGDNTNLTIRVGSYPIIRGRRYGGDSASTTYALVVVDGVNYFVNQLGAALSKVRKTSIMGERRMWKYTDDARVEVMLTTDNP